MVGAFWGSRIMEIVKKETGGLVWPKLKLTSTRKSNAKKRLRRVWQNEAVLRACSEPPPSASSVHDSAETVAKDGLTSQT